MQRPPLIPVRRLALVAVFAPALAGCPKDPDFIECRDETSCDRHGDGACLLNPETGHHFCTYPADDCPSGRRWSDLDVEDVIAGSCVEGSDAGIDAAPDTIPPMVISRAPEGNSTQTYPRDSLITVTFSEPLAPASVTIASFVVRDMSDSLVAGQLSVSSASATFTPSALLSSPTYRVTLTTDITDVAGNALAEQVSWYFNVAL